LFINRTTKLVSALCLVALVYGCAQMPQLDSFPVSGTASDVKAKWGSPSVTRKTAFGERWIYTTAMEGRETWFVDFDEVGKAKPPVQVLTPERVSSLRIGMQIDEVESTIGPKYYELRYPFKSDQPVHIYRYLRSPHEAVCLYVHYSAQGKVVEIGYAPDALRVITLKRACQT
jgi:hypothetical protein